MAAGHVANFVETEQLVIVEGRGTGGGVVAVASHVQVRGSIPLLWGHPAHLRYRAPLALKDPLAPAGTSAEGVADSLVRSEGALVAHVNALLET